MQDNKKTNKKTIIFQSAEIKDFCDALIYAKSKKTGISIMRLIENALINEFGFKNGKLSEWCCNYCKDSATTSYVSLLRLLPQNEDVFVLYKIICNYVGITLFNDAMEQHAVVKNIINNGGRDSNISDEKAIERIFMLCDRKDLDKVFYDFNYGNSSKLDDEPVPLEDIVLLLLTVETRGEEAE